MEPDEVTATVQELGADTSEEANTNLGSAVATCGNPILNVGIFFDGTYNDAYDDTIPRTNVHRLFSNYKTARDNIYADGGNCLQEVFVAGYVQGIGAGASGVDRALGGGASGQGSAGVLDRLRQGTDFLRTQILAHGGFDGVQEVRVDVFGFSRGAATARIFCNALAAAGVAKLKIRFMGIFDTVGSFGVPGDDREGYFVPPQTWVGQLGFAISPTLYSLSQLGNILDLDIRSDSAETVFHVTAMDELRAYFPLSRAKPGHATEVDMPGSHGDVGGAYFDRTYEETYSNQEVNAHPFLRTNGWLETAERTHWSDRHGNQRAGGYRRTVQPRLTMVSLFAMHTQALAAEVPLHPYNHPSFGEDVSVPGPLMPLAQQLAGGQSADPATARWVRARYSHTSWGGIIDNRIEWDMVRDEYPNEP